MPNPFMLTGFSFLAFYLVIGIVVNWKLRSWFRSKETKASGRKPQLTDPYQIAYLRTGEPETLRIATVALIDRGLLTSEDDVLKTRDDLAVELVNRPIERAILNVYRTAGDSDKIFTDANATAACEEYRKRLTEHGLLADASTYRERFVPTVVALAILLLVTAIKISIALSQGRHNILFLIILTLFFSIAVYLGYRKRLTEEGAAVVADLKRLFARLQRRAKTIPAGGQTNEAALLAAIFGLTALPVANFPFLKKLYPNKSNDGGGSGCGSSSSSCGSSCGGGGCGGGCGG